MQWYVRVDERNYGPYDDHQMQAFVIEGRVNANSAISTEPSQGFFAATRFEAFRLWSAPQEQPHTAFTNEATQAQVKGFATAPTQSINSAKPATQTWPALTQAPQRNNQALQPTAPASVDGDIKEASPFIIMAEIQSDKMMDFLQCLQSVGRTERVGASVWVVKSTLSPDELRNSLSQTLTRQDRLFIVDSLNNKTAWFNIGADLDARIRDLWA